MSVLQFNLEHGIAQCLDNRSVLFNQCLFGHKIWSAKIGEINEDLNKKSYYYTLKRRFFMKKLILGSFCLILTAVSCKKSSQTEFQYITTTPGTTWNYQSTDNSTSAVSTYTRLSTDRDTTISNKSYHIFNNTDANGSTDAFYNLTGNDYYQFSTLATGLDPIDLHYLNDAAVVGTGWNQSFSVPVPNSPIQGLMLTIHINYSVVEKGTSLVVNGKTYTNVVKIKSDVTIDPVFGLSVSTTSNIYNYYAPKYGLIKSDFNLVASLNGTEVINTNTTDLLMSSSIQ